MRGKIDYRDFRVRKPRSEGIVKVGEFYFIWSLEDDMPVTEGMKRDDFKEYYKEEYNMSEILTERKLRRYVQ